MLHILLKRRPLPRPMRRPIKKKNNLHIRQVLTDIQSAAQSRVEAYENPY